MNFEDAHWHDGNITSITLQCPKEQGGTSSLSMSCVLFEDNEYGERKEFEVLFPQLLQFDSEVDLDELRAHIGAGSIQNVTEENGPNECDYFIELQCGSLKLKSSKALVRRIYTPKVINRARPR
jgi:hypothetical protein